MSPFVTHALDVKRAWVLFPEPKVNRNDPKAAESSFLAAPTRWLEKQRSGCSDLLTKIEAMTRDFFLTPEIAPFRQLDSIRLKNVSSEEHSTNKAFPFIALASSVKSTQSGTSES